MSKSAGSATVLLAAILVGAYFAYAGATGQSPVGELKATFRNQPTPPRSPSILSTLNKATTATLMAAHSPAPTDGTFNPGTPATTGPASTAAQGAVAFALAHLGDPYVAGAHGPHAFDCSTLTEEAYKSVGVQWPAPTYTQVGLGAHVDIGPNGSLGPANARPGDCLFSQGDVPRRRFGHTGIVIGPNEKVHAPQTGDVVRRAPIDWPNVQELRRPVP